MGRGRGRPAMTPDEKAQKKFNEIPVEWRDRVAGLSADEIKDIIAEVAGDENENQKAKDEDRDLAEKRVLFQEAGAQYKEGTKMNRLKTKFALRVLGDRGGLKS